MHITSSGTASGADISTLPMGCSILNDSIIFRLFSPRAEKINLVIFDSYEHSTGEIYAMEKDNEGVWNLRIDGTDPINKWYAYQIESQASDKWFQHSKRYIADPWSTCVTSRNHYLGYHKSRICKTEPFDWQGTSYVCPDDIRDLIIYETHIKDMIAHPSAETLEEQGVYTGFRKAKQGGISHLKRMGVNAVEFLPLQKFGYFEPPFEVKLESGLKNTWNPYSKNYWGYMTSFYFVPEPIYASDGSTKADNIVGLNKRAHTELKELIRDLHKEGISVILDVVYNHASQYDLNPLKYTAKDEYFRLDQHGNYQNDSWTGNDINTANTQSRKLIIESVKYWMREFHIDGFRFDLAGIIDWDTIDQLTDEAKSINPDVIMIAEPWGGEYKPIGFSERNWGSWNDRIRNGFKGYDPLHSRGFIFGEWIQGTTRFAIENFFRGTLLNADHGLFLSSEHSINYLESHDGYTLGDFIRIVLDPAKLNKKFDIKDSVLKLTNEELSIAKLAALCLFVSQGATMIHAGQEWARTKVIYDPEGKDPKNGMLDVDSYNKDNQTNWLDFADIEVNRELYDYYRMLIKLRLNSPALRKAKPAEIIFKVYNEALHVTFSIDGSSSDDPYDYFISVNAHRNDEHEIILPSGTWQLVAEASVCDPEGIKNVQKKLSIAPSSGVILRKLRVSAA